MNAADAVALTVVLRWSMGKPDSAGAHYGDERATAAAQALARRAYRIAGAGIQARDVDLSRAATVARFQAIMLAAGRPAAAGDLADAELREARAEIARLTRAVRAKHDELATAIEQRDYWQAQAASWEAADTLASQLIEAARDA